MGAADVARVVLNTPRLQATNPLPTIVDGHISNLTPLEARLRNLTYAAPLYCYVPKLNPLCTCVKLYIMVQVLQDWLQILTRWVQILGGKGRAHSYHCILISSMRFSSKFLTATKEG